MTTETNTTAIRGNLSGSLARRIATVAIAILISLGWLANADSQPHSDKGSANAQRGSTGAHGPSGTIPGLREPQATDNTQGISTQVTAADPQPNNVAIKSLPRVNVDVSKDWSDRGYFWFSLLLVLVGAVQAVFLIKTWQATHEGARAAHDNAVAAQLQRDVMAEQREVMDQQANYMRETLEITKRSTDVSVIAMKVSRRPWIQVVSVEIKQPIRFTEDGHASATVSIKIKNTGLSPAFGVVNGNALIVTHAGYDMGQLRLHMIMQQATLRQLSNIAGATMFPEGDLELTDDKLSAPPVAIIATLKDPPILVFLVIVICYRDEFGDIHTTGSPWGYHDRNKKSVFQASGTIYGSFRSASVTGISD